MTVTVSSPGLAGGPDAEKAAVAAAGLTGWTALTSLTWAEPLTTVVAALAGAWVPPRRDLAGRDGLRPSLGQLVLGQEMVRAAEDRAAGLVAHVCAWVMPCDYGAPVPRAHDSLTCLALYEAWRWADDKDDEDTATRLAQTDARGVEEAERVAWRLGTSLRLVRWADGLLRQAEIAGAVALFEAWRAELRRGDRITQAWDAYAATEQARVGRAGRSAHGTVHEARRLHRDD